MGGFVRVCLLGSCLAALAPVDARAAAESILDSDYVRVPGTRVSIMPPPGFHRAQSFLGFVASPRIARISVAVTPQSVIAAVAAATNEALAESGMKVLSREPMQVDGFPSQLVVVEHDSEMGPLVSWTLLFGNLHRHVRLMASCLQREREEFAEPLRAALVGARWRPREPLDPFEGLSFAIRGDTKFQFAERVTDRVTFTKDGVLPPQHPTDPALVIVETSETIFEGDQATYCAEQLDEATDFPELRVTHSNPIEVRRIAGCEAIGQALLEGEPLLIYQAAIFGRRKLYLFKARVGWRGQQLWLPEMRGMVSRFRLR